MPEYITDLEQVVREVEGWSAALGDLSTHKLAVALGTNQRRIYRLLKGQRIRVTAKERSAWESAYRESQAFFDRGQLDQHLKRLVVLRALMGAGSTPMTSLGPSGESTPYTKQQGLADQLGRLLSQIEFDSPSIELTSVTLKAVRDARDRLQTLRSPPALLLLGRVNRGKTTLARLLCDLTQDDLPVRMMRMTKVTTMFHHVSAIPESIPKSARHEAFVLSGRFDPSRWWDASQYRQVEEGGCVLKHGSLKEVVDDLVYIPRLKDVESYSEDDEEDAPVEHKAPGESEPKYAVAFLNRDFLRFCSLIDLPGLPEGPLDADDVPRLPEIDVFAYLIADHSAESDAEAIARNITSIESSSNADAREPLTLSDLYVVMSRISTASDADVDVQMELSLRSLRRFSRAGYRDAAAGKDRGGRWSTESPPDGAQERTIGRDLIRLLSESSVGAVRQQMRRFRMPPHVGAAPDDDGVRLRRELIELFRSEVSPVAKRWNRRVAAELSQLRDMSSEHIRFAVERLDELNSDREALVRRHQGERVRYRLLLAESKVHREELLKKAQALEATAEKRFDQLVRQLSKPALIERLLSNAFRVPGTKKIDQRKANEDGRQLIATRFERSYTLRCVSMPRRRLNQLCEDRIRLSVSRKGAAHGSSSSRVDDATRDFLDVAGRRDTLFARLFRRAVRSLSRSRPRQVEFAELGRSEREFRIAVLSGHIAQVFKDGQEPPRSRFLDGCRNDLRDEWKLTFAALNQAFVQFDDILRKYLHVMDELVAERPLHEVDKLIAWAEEIRPFLDELESHGAGD